MKHTSYVTVRTYELDSYNHVNNSVYLNYLEYARMDFLKAAGFNYNKLIEEGFMLYVTRIDIKYKFSARFDDTLAIEVEPIKLGKVSGTFRQTIKNQQGQICAEAEVTWASVNKDGRPAKMPEEYFIKALIPDGTVSV